MRSDEDWSRIPYDCNVGILDDEMSLRPISVVIFVTKTIEVLPVLETVRVVDIAVVANVT